MKNLTLLSLAFMLLVTNCRKGVDLTPQSSCNFIDFKYYRGTHDSIGEMMNNYILVGIDTMHSDILIKNFISTVTQLDPNYTYKIHASSQYRFKEIPLRLKSSKTCEEITLLISELEKNTLVAYVHYTMKTNYCKDLVGQPIGNMCVKSFGSNFYVKVINPNDLTQLNQTIAETNTELVKQNNFMPKWFELRATKNSNGDALKMANYFYETGFFEASEPGLSTYPVE